MKTKRISPLAGLAILMKQPILHTLAWLVVALTCTRAGLAQAERGTLLQFDFEDAGAWGRKSVPSAGTIDVAGGKEGSAGLVLAVEAAAAARGNWSADLSSGPLALRNAETNLGKLTLGFSLSASAASPVRVRVESFDAQKKRTGGMEALIYPAAPDFYQRYAIDLDTMNPDGQGSFRPADPYVGFSFEIGGGIGWMPGKRHEIRLDNVHYARPALYVSPAGCDSNDGRTDKTPLATPRKAVAAAQPGDIILLMGGTYPNGRSAVSFQHGGTPSAWITLKNYPGQEPVLLNEGWNCIAIGRGSKKSPSPGPAPAYIEVRGLHIRGNADVADKKYPEALNQADPRTNGNGISADGRYEQNVPHHLRFANNVVEFCSGAGISVLESDWVTIENNLTRNNCWWTIYATSGISILGASNFDGSEGNYKHLVRNNVSTGNRCNLKWKDKGVYSDGNGIILDINKGTEDRPKSHFLGRILVQGNLSCNNGGSGIHAYSANKVDIINNTAWMNSASPELQYGQIFANDCDDVRIVNNILVAPVANIAAGEKPEPVNGNNKCKNVVYAHNIYFGGNKPPVMGDGDRIADPLFVVPSADFGKADFRLRPRSPALQDGIWMPFTPIIDLTGKVRPANHPPDAGAYQK